MTRDDIIRMYEKANGWSPAGWDKTVKELERFANLIAEHEREECAQIAEHVMYGREGCARTAAAIRARGQE